MTVKYASLIVGQGDSEISTSLTKEQYDEYLQNGMDYEETDSKTGQQTRFHIVFIPFFVFENHFPPSLCKPAPVFIVRGRAPFLLQGCISSRLVLERKR